MQCPPLDGDGDNEHEEEDYSFSLSGLPEEISDAKRVKLIEDSISFSFSTKYPSETECPPFGFTSTLPLSGYSHTQASMADDQAVRPDDSEDAGREEPDSSMVPFQVSGSWPGEVSLRHLSRNSESRCSFSFLTDLEHEETRHLEDCSGPIILEMSAMHAAYVEVAKREGNKLNIRDNLNLEAGDGKDTHADIKSYTQGGHAFGEQGDCFKFSKRAYSDPAASVLRFAGERLLQPWSPSIEKGRMSHQTVPWHEFRGRKGGRERGREHQCTSRQLTVLLCRGFARFINVRDSSGATPLHLAAQSSHAAVVHLLLGKGALVSATTTRSGGSGCGFGSTPLHFATSGGSTECVKVLLAWGADRMQRNSHGMGY